MVLIHQSIEFHNTAALEPLHGLPGLALVRFPRAVREALNPRGRFIAALAVGCELRFVTPAPTFQLTLLAHADEVRLQIYCGDFAHSEPVLAPGQTRVLHLSPPERFALVPRATLSTTAFSPEVWRVQISGGGVSFLGLDTLGFPLRPPAPTEKPRLRWLAHGSSITHSWAKGYPHQAARRLRADVLNKGMSGSCHCEPELAAHLATESWHFATLELGVNMRGEFSPEAFALRAARMLDTLLKAKPGAPVFLITHFPNLDHHPLGEPGLAGRRQAAFDETLRELARRHAAQGVHLIEGREVLTDFHGLSADLLHPSDHGHVQMGENLARLLSPHLTALQVS